MKRIISSLCAVLLSVSAISQNTFTVGNLTYEITSENTVEVHDCATSAISVTIPETINTNDGITYNVTSIGSNAFQYNYSLEEVTIPNSVTAIAISAFDNAGKRDTINGIVYAGNDTLNVSNYKFTNIGFLKFHLGNETYQTTEASVVYCDRDKSGAVIICDTITFNGNPYPVTFIKGKAFYNCDHITSATIPNTVVAIGRNGDTQGAFDNCNNLLSVTIGCNVKSIGENAFYNCINLDSIVCLASASPTLYRYAFKNIKNTRKRTIPFGSNYNAWEDSYAWSKTYYLIQENDTVSLESDFMITNEVGLINNGVLRIPYGKQLIDTTNSVITGIIEIETPILDTTKWSFVGAPLSNYKLEAIKPGTRDVAVSTFDYTTGNWSNEWATIESPIGTGEGFFLWSFANEPTVFTTDSESGLQKFFKQHTRNHSNKKSYYLSKRKLVRISKSIHL